jgi:hypothetical protein
MHPEKGARREREPNQRPIGVDRCRSQALITGGLSQRIDVGRDKLALSLGTMQMGYGSPVFPRDRVE